MFSNLLSDLLSKTAPTPPANNNKPPRTHNRPIRTTYISNPIPLPASFLTTPSPDSLPITLTPLDFATSPLPEYSRCHALVLDNVLSPSECATLLRLAEASVPAPGKPGSELRHGADDPWAPALVNVGGGFEVLEQDYRNSDRIVWDCQEVVDRIWGRCLQAQAQGPEGGVGGVGERFGEVAGMDRGVVGREWGGVWRFLRVNERMRFLRYGKGGFFRRKFLMLGRWGRVGADEG